MMMTTEQPDVFDEFRAHVPCVCEHPAATHRGVIVPIDGQVKADFARLLGSCQSCPCPRYAPTHSGRQEAPHDG